MRGVARISTAPTTVVADRVGEGRSVGAGAGLMRGRQPRRLGYRHPWRASPRAPSTACGRWRRSRPWRACRPAGTSHERPRTWRRGWRHGGRPSATRGQPRAHERPATPDRSSTGAMAAVAHDRCQAGKGADRPAFEMAEFRRLRDQGERHDRPDPWHRWRATLHRGQRRIGPDRSACALLDRGDASVAAGEGALDVGASLAIGRLL